MRSPPRAVPAPARQSQSKEASPAKAAVEGAGGLNDAVEARVNEQIEELVRAQSARIAGEVASRVAGLAAEKDGEVKDAVEREVKNRIAAGVANSEARIKERVEATLQVSFWLQRVAFFAPTFPFGTPSGHSLEHPLLHLRGH
jgi:hypothetical protein